MNCIDFRRLALSDPKSRDAAFVEHGKSCPDCRKYISEVRQMDAGLVDSLEVAIPSDLVARLQLNQELNQQEEKQPFWRAVDLSKWSVNKWGGNYAIAASFAAALFVAGFIVSNQLNPNNQIGADYETLLSGVVEHMNETTITPVWGPDRANRAANALLASYDGDMKLKYLENLQFSRICPMGRYRGLHASLETEDGQVTFAYIKGDSVGDLLDAGYEGYVTRVKPVRGGNLIIMSRTTRSLETVDKQLQEAMYWEI